jgi:hypothetical protein
MTAGQQRKLQRLVHLVAGAALLAYVYLPLDAAVEDFVRFVAFPALVASGLAMWQAPRIRRFRRTLETWERSRA